MTTTVGAASQPRQTTTSQLVDLGIVSDGTDLAQANHTGRRPWYRLVLVTLNVLTLITSATVSWPPSATIITSASSSPLLAVTATALYVADVTAVDTTTVTAYDPTTAAVHWRSRFSLGSTDHLTVSANGAALLVQQLAQKQAWLVALDLATGTVLWRHSGTMLAQLASGWILLAAGPLNGPNTLDAVATATGRLAWRHSLPAQASVTVIDPGSGRQPGRVLLVDSTGNATVLDVASGAVRQRLSLAHPPATSLAVTVLATAPDRAVVSYYAADRGLVLAAFHLPDLLPEWTATHNSGAWRHLESCGTSLCEASGDSLTVVDPSTGTVRWKADAASWLHTLNGDIPTQQPDGSAVVRDINSGRVMFSVTGWMPVAGPDELLWSSDTLTGNRTWFATVDDAGVQPRGYLTDVRPWTCQSGGGHLACLRGRDDLVITSNLTAADAHDMTAIRPRAG